MSSSINPSTADLDRTEELPVLNVEEYEASLGEYETNLSRTDVWAVPNVGAVDTWDEGSAEACPATHVVRPISLVEAPTTDIESILRRIAGLEAEISEAHEAKAALRNQCEALREGLSKEQQQMEVLRQDHARLSQDLAQSDAASRRLDQQLSEQAESIAALEKCLSNEKDRAAHLSQQLACKLMEWETAGATIELRNRTIDELTQRLQQEIAAGIDLTAQLTAAEQNLHESHGLLLDRENVIGQKDALLAQAQAQIQSLTDERNNLRTASAQFEARAANLEQMGAQVTQLRDELVAALAEAERQARLLNENMNEIGRLRSQLDERERVILVQDEQTAELTAQLQAAHEERASMIMQIDNARERAKKLTDQIFRRDNRIAVLEADLAVHEEALATIRRDVNRIGHRPPDSEFGAVEHTLEAVEHEGPMLSLTREVMTVGRTNDNDICIPSKLVSRYHARLLVGPTGVIVEDAKSMNGCYVNGEQIRQHLMRDGDVLELGGIRYRLRSRSARDRSIQSPNVRQLPTAARRIGSADNLMTQSFVPVNT